MKRTKIEAVLVVIVTLTLALTAGAWGYHEGRSAVVTSMALTGTVQHAAVPESYAVPQQIPVLCFHGIGTPSSRGVRARFHAVRSGVVPGRAGPVADDGRGRLQPGRGPAGDHVVNRSIPGT